jgi:dienelactone hydrolase
MAGAKLDRTWAPVDATIEHVSSNGLVGYFIAPKGADHGPAIITFGGSEGGLGTGQLLAQYYASLGYACLGLAYFGAPGLPAELDHVPLEYFGTALQWISQRREVDPARVAVMGGSRGGELALLLGATYPQIKAVVATVPSGLIWPADVAGPSQPAWTLGGQALPFVPSTSMRIYTSVDAEGRTLYAEAPMFLDDIEAAAPAALEAATIPVERTQGPVLIIAGRDDRLWASCALGAFAHARLKRSGHQRHHGDQVYCYPDAGHAIVQPGLPTTDANAYYEARYDFWLDLGGTPAGIAHAERDADGVIRRFLNAHLR